MINKQTIIISCGFGERPVTELEVRNLQEEIAKQLAEQKPFSKNDLGLLDAILSDFAKRAFT